MKENKYDKESFFQKYSRMPRSVEGLRAAGEWHVMRTMLPGFAGKRLLDLGCGFGWHCRYASEQGATQVVGIDISRKMLEGAQRLNEGHNIEYANVSIEDYEYPEDAFDIVLSSLALHYVASIEDLFPRIAASLSKGGRFVFSAEHPAFTAVEGQQWVDDDQGNHLHWPVDNYFFEGRRETNFLDEKVIKYHRTTETYIENLLKNGFEITGFSEPRPSEQMLEALPEMSEELRRPMMIIISALKR